MNEPHFGLRRLLRWGALGVLAVAFGALLLLQQTRLERELRELPAVERKALYERTLETLRNSCAQPSGVTLNDYCREQAEFVEGFPECDGQCRNLAARIAPQPWR